MFWFGVRDDLVTSDSATITHEIYTSKGILADGTNGFLTTNSSTANSSGDYTEDEFDTDLITAFRYGNGVKFAFCSPTALGTISSWGRDKIRLIPRDKTYGISISRYISPHDPELKKIHRHSGSRDAAIRNPPRVVIRESSID